MTQEVRDCLKKAKTTVSCIPGGCTKLVQPADVSWNQPFKASYREMYEEWLQSDERAGDVTSAGNPRAPSKRKMAEWVVKAWRNLSPEIIIRSFSACGITTANPDEIHCIKHGIAPDALAVIEGGEGDQHVEDDSESEEDKEGETDNDEEQDVDYE